MAQASGIILSASRRTDIPAFYLDWFMDRIFKGYFDIKNPYSRQIRRVEATCDKVHAIVFWSKNFEPLLTSGAGEKLNNMGYHLFFNFTVNSHDAFLEPMLPPLESRLDQMEKLSHTFGAQHIAWRFDPVCFFQTRQNGPVKNNLTHFPVIAHKASSLGIKKCVTSFFDPYAKIERRLKKIGRTQGRFLNFVDPPLEQKAVIIQNMADNLAQLNIGLHLCCEKELFDCLPAFSPVKQNACIDGPALKQLLKGAWPVKKDYGQRSKKGCNCSRSVDVGSYDDHPCPHNCIFCYARPLMDSSPVKRTANRSV
jgi:hypothetical protein